MVAMNQQFIDDITARTKEIMGIPPCFIDRGDPAAADFTTVDFTVDNAWHDLDLSGIVPANAVAVLFRVENRNNNFGVFIQIRKKSNSNLPNRFEQNIQVANVSLSDDGICPIGTNGLLEYLLIPVGFWLISFTVKGWWL